MILEKKVAGLSAQALARFVLRARRAAGLDGTVDVLVAGNAMLRSLNQRFRGKSTATDVLSFPSEPLARRNDKRGFAGEIAISADIAAQNAVRFGHAAGVEVRILALHGILHLAGMDHEHDNGEMARKEARLRRTLRLPSSLMERATAERSTARRITARRARRMA